MRCPLGGTVAGIDGRRVDHLVQRASENGHPPPFPCGCQWEVSWVSLLTQTKFTHTAGELRACVGILGTGDTRAAVFSIIWCILPRLALSLSGSVFQLCGDGPASFPSSLTYTRRTCQCPILKWELLSFGFSDGTRERTVN